MAVVTVVWLPRIVQDDNVPDCQGLRGIPGDKGDVGSHGVKGDKVSLVVLFRVVAVRL